MRKPHDFRTARPAAAALALALAAGAVPASAQLTIQDVIRQAVKNPEESRSNEERTERRSTPPLTLRGVTPREVRDATAWLLDPNYRPPEERRPPPPPEPRYVPPPEPRYVPPPQPRFEPVQQPRFTPPPPSTRSVAATRPVDTTPTVPASGDWREQADNSAQASGQEEFGLGEFDF